MRKIFILITSFILLFSLFACNKTTTTVTTTTQTTPLYKNTYTYDYDFEKLEKVIISEFKNKEVYYVEGNNISSGNYSVT